MTEELNTFESAVLVEILAGDHPALDLLKSQLALASVRARETVESGCLVDFWIESGPPSLEVEHRFAIDDLQGQVEGSSDEIAFLLHIVRGRIKTLEIFAMEGELPSELQLAESWYVAPDAENAGRPHRVSERSLSYALRGLTEQDVS